MTEINKLNWCPTTNTGCHKEVNMLLPIKSVSEFKELIDNVPPEKKQPLNSSEVAALVKILSECQVGGKTHHA